MVIQNDTAPSQTEIEHARRECFKILIALVMVFCSSFVLAQDYPRREINPERLVDEIFPQQNLDINYQVLYENYLQLLTNPLDLNRASGEELRTLYILSENQVESLLRYRETNGLLLSVYELQSVPGFDLATIYKLMPFAVVRDLTTTLNHAFPRRVLEEHNNYLILRDERTLESQHGYQKSSSAATRYVGSPDQLYLRFRVSRPGDFSIGITSEKDAGEKIEFNPKQHYYGMDFLSFHAQVVRKGWIKNLIVGDFLGQFGQGLVLGGGFGMGKGSETITTLRRTNLGFIPYTSSGETGFFRGVATSLMLSKNTALHLFASGVRRDAVANQDSVDDNYSFISSFAVTGYHRTPNEVATRKQILETNYGGVISYRLQNFETGVIFHKTDFSLPISKNPTVYNQFTFGGQHNTNLSTFVNYTRNNFTVFSEAAHTVDHGAGVVAGALFSITRKLDVSMLYRHYQKNFYTFYSNAIAENTLPQNETGMYWGWKYVWSKKYSSSGYIDVFRFPWLRYRAYAPSDGSEWMMRFNYQPSKTVLFFVQMREESKIRNLSDENNLYRTGIGTKKNFSINCDYAANARLNFKTRAQFSSYSIGGKTSRGMVLIQDAGVDIGKFSFSGRYSIFHTDDYDTRLYVYERDVLLAFSFPAYFGTGVHTVAMIRYRLMKSMDLWVRWSHTRYADRDVIGTGGEAINGNQRNDVKMQVRISL